jgi:hypothetical protein
VMDQILYGLPFVQCYINDVIIFSKTPQEHIKRLQVVFERLRTSISRSYDYSRRSLSAASQSGHFAEDPDRGQCAETSCFLGVGKFLASFHQEL